MKKNEIKTETNDVVKQTKQQFNQRKFITDIYECEKQKYILSERKKILGKEINKEYILPDFKTTSFYKNYLKEYRSKKPIPKVPDQRPEFTSGEIFDAIVTTGLIPGAIIGVIVNIVVIIITHSAVPWFLIIAIAVTAGSLIFNLCMHNGDVKRFNYGQQRVEDVKKYNNDTIKYNNERYEYWRKEFKKSEENKLKNFQKSKEKILTEEIRAINKKIDVIKETLDMLYNLRLNGVLCLHPNYQGLVPISVIYGYFDTGRCTTLQGHEGAYNLYEDEKLKGLIINKLDLVSKQLGNLQSSMIYVGQAISECNRRLSDLESTSNRMISSVNNMNTSISKQIGGVSAQLSGIDENVANGAYYAEVGAKMATMNTVYNLLSE